VIAFIAALAVVAVLAVIVWVAVSREPGPSPVDVAVAYERAWDELDFSLLYDLSGDELRDGLRKERFVAAKRAALASAGPQPRLGASVEVETSIVGNQTALVVTNVQANGARVRNNVMLEKRSNGWLVVGYSLRHDAGTGPAP
jgi:hypothetical protein